MKIAAVDAFAVSMPLPAPVSDAVRRIEQRDHFLVRIRTAEGVEGVGLTPGYDSSLAMVSLTETASSGRSCWAATHSARSNSGRRCAGNRFRPDSGARRFVPSAPWISRSGMYGGNRQGFIEPQTEPGFGMVFREQELRERRLG